MARIKTLVPEEVTGIRRLFVWLIKRQYGGILPGITRIGLVNLNTGRPMNKLYQYLHLRKGSPFTRLQREMVATVVNGLIGGAP